MAKSILFHMHPVKRMQPLISDVDFVTFINAFTTSLSPTVMCCAWSSPLRPLKVQSRLGNRHLFPHVYCIQYCHGSHQKSSLNFIWKISIFGEDPWKGFSIPVVSQSLDWLATQVHCKARHFSCTFWGVVGLE